MRGVGATHPLARTLNLIEYGLLVAALIAVFAAGRILL